MPTLNKQNKFWWLTELIKKRLKRNAKQSDLPRRVACRRWVKCEWEAADEVSEEPNRIRPVRDESRQRFPGRVEARRRQRGMAVVTGGKSGEIQEDQARAGRLEGSELQALCCSAARVFPGKTLPKPPGGFSFLPAQSAIHLDLSHVWKGNKIMAFPEGGANSRRA